MRCSWAQGIFGVLFAVVGLDAAAQTATPAAGVPLDLATRRAAIVSDLRYELALSVPDRTQDPVSGTVEMRFQLADASAPLVLDFD
jgi:hypothetical protein